MASLIEVVRTLSKHIFCFDHPDRVYNDLRIRANELTKIGLYGEEPLIRIYGRGRYAKDVTAEDCALILISILVNDKANGVSEVVRVVKDLKIVDIKKDDKNLKKIADLLDKDINQLTLLDCLSCIIEDQAFGNEDLSIVTTIMATQYKKLENESLGFYITIDWHDSKSSNYSAINKISDEDLKKIKPTHAYNEHEISRNLPFLSFGNSIIKIINLLGNNKNSLPDNRYSKLNAKDQILQRSPSYVRKVKIGGDTISIIAELIKRDLPSEKMMAANSAPVEMDVFDEFILQKILFHLMSTNIRSFAELNTKSIEFLKMHEEIIDYCDKSEIPALRIGDIQDIRKRFNDLDRGKKDSNEILNNVYEQFRFNKELLQQTLTGLKKGTQ